MRFHHVAYRTKRGTLATVEALFLHLGFRLLARSVTAGEAAMWMEPEPANGRTTVQFNETESYRVGRKMDAHIAFLNEDPKAAADALVQWCAIQHIQTEVGQWSEREQWVDCPELFADFVIEILHPSVVGE